MNKALKSIATGVTALSISAGNAFADQPVEPSKLDATPGSADSCVLSNRISNAHIALNVPVNSIQTCYNLANLHRMSEATAMNGDDIVLHLSREQTAPGGPITGTGASYAYSDRTPD